MSSTGETLTLMMADRITFPKAPTATSQAPAKGRRAATKQPSEISSSYFPNSSPSPTFSSASPLSASSETDEETPVSVTSRASPMIGTNYPIPPLERQYTPPTEELDVAAQLARKPLPRSLHSSLQRAAATASTKKPVVEDEETRAKKLADAKRELLALAGHI
ncbi:hypothetical protein GGR54DRAFT_637138 [Hypoxylon sp. NC1633]|nr:hypothetical protein GGR54DRAFT_637138 [Hypoxylon sp. NC1633]